VSDHPSVDDDEDDGLDVEAIRAKVRAQLMKYRPSSNYRMHIASPFLDESISIACIFFDTILVSTAAEEPQNHPCPVHVAWQYPHPNSQRNRRRYIAASLYMEAGTDDDREVAIQDQGCAGNAQATGPTIRRKERYNLYAI
jgi:hypothetical protein